MPAKIPLVGRRFGRLRVVSDLPRTRPRRYVLCRCDCGAQRPTAAQDLMRGEAQSCGCLHRELLAARNFRHGEAGRNTAKRTPEYRAWQEMRRRCYDKDRKGYDSWGGRGITVSPRWLQSFDNFLADVGRRPTSDRSLDRIDNDGNYEPGNVRWATPKEQRTNQRPH